MMREKCTRKKRESERIHNNKKKDVIGREEKCEEKLEWMKMYYLYVNKESERRQINYIKAIFRLISPKKYWFESGTPF